MSQDQDARIAAAGYRASQQAAEYSRAAQSDLDTARAIGSMSANIETLMERQDKMDKKLDAVVAMTNRWKGATAILIIVGGIIGYLGNWVLKLTGKA